MDKILKQLREMNNYSQNSIATFLNISRQMYIKYEQGEVDPPVKVIRELAHFYRVPYEYIIDGTIGDAVCEKSMPSAEGAIHREMTYPDETAEPLLEVADPAGQPVLTEQASYLGYIMDMLPKLIYTEKLELMEKLCELLKGETGRKERINRKRQAFQKIIDLSDELHICSDGTKMTREEIYDRY
ncbi:MAG: helix-turn-helix transcriptional regulator [Treponema sp.]|nr:helix-turn-helix transcriptional regulator [Candidatus Treponema caballi]